MSKKESNPSPSFPKPPAPNGPPDVPHSLHKDAHPSASYACPRCSKLSSLLSEMASNPPGRRGVETPFGRLGNAHIDLGWVTAVNMLARRLEQEEDVSSSDE